MLTPQRRGTLARCVPALGAREKTRSGPAILNNFAIRGRFRGNRRLSFRSRVDTSPHRAGGRGLDPADDGWEPARKDFIPRRTATVEARPDRAPSPHENMATWILTENISGKMAPTSRRTMSPPAGKFQGCPARGPWSTTLFAEVLAPTTMSSSMKKFINTDDVHFFGNSPRWRATGQAGSDVLSGENWRSAPEELPDGAAPDS